MTHTRLKFLPRSTPLGPNDISTMASLLVSKHGKHAADVASFMAREQAAYKDHARALAWQAVRSLVSDALEGRLPQQKMQIH